MRSVEAEQERGSDSGPISKSRCLPQPPKTPEIPLVVINRPFRGIEVGAVVGTRKRPLRKEQLYQVEVIAGKRTGKVVEEIDDRLKFIGHQEPPKAPPTPENKRIRIDY